LLKKLLSVNFLNIEGREL